MKRGFMNSIAGFFFKGFMNSIRDFCTILKSLSYAKILKFKKWLKEKKQLKTSEIKLAVCIFVDDDSWPNWRYQKCEIEQNISKSRNVKPGNLEMWKN